MNDVYTQAHFDISEENMLLNLEKTINNEHNGRFTAKEVIPAFGGYKVVTKNTKVPARLRIEIPIVPVDDDYVGFKKILSGEKEDSILGNYDVNVSDSRLNTNFDMPIVLGDNGKPEYFRR
jgi:hypothetical protein